MVKVNILNLFQVITSIKKVKQMDDSTYTYIKREWFSPILRGEWLPE